MKSLLLSPVKHWIANNLVIVLEWIYQTIVLERIYQKGHIKNCYWHLQEKFISPFDRSHWHIWMKKKFKIFWSLLCLWHSSKFISWHCLLTMEKIEKLVMVKLLYLKGNKRLIRLSIQWNLSFIYIGHIMFLNGFTRRIKSKVLIDITNNCRN